MITSVMVGDDSDTTRYIYLSDFQHSYDAVSTESTPALEVSGLPHPLILEDHTPVTDSQ